MQCGRCSSNNVTIQVIDEQNQEPKKHGILWWLFIGWWWFIVKWTFFTIPALIFALLVDKDKNTKNKYKRVAVCQNCGHTWSI